MNKTAAATLLSVRPDVIDSVDDSPAGPVIRTTDGAAYIDVADGNPDADGKTGLMFLTAPTANYAGGFPVYTSAGDEQSADVDEPLEMTLEAFEPFDYLGHTVDEVLEHVGEDPDRAAEALGYESVSGTVARKGVVEPIEEFFAALREMDAPPAKPAKPGTQKASKEKS